MDGQYEQNLRTSREQLDTVFDRLEKRLAAALASGWTQRKALFWSAVVVALASFGIDIFNVSLSIDEEAHSISAGPLREWIKQDRWGMYVLNALLLPLPVLPYISGILGVLAVAGAASFAIPLWGDGRTGPGRLSAALMAATPVLAFVYHFNTSQYGFFIGLWAAVMAVSMFITGGRFRVCVSCLLLMFAVSVYQAVAMAACCVYLFWIINRRVLAREATSPERSLARECLIFFAWFAAALVMHKATSVMARTLSVPQGGYQLVDGVYSGSWIRSYRPTAVLGQIGDMLLGGAWYMGWQSGTMIVVCTAVIVGRVLRSPAGFGTRMVGLAAVAAALLSPFVLVILTGSAWPARTLLGVPVLVAGLAFTASGVGRSSVRLGVWAICVICLMSYIVSNNRLMYADQLRWWSDHNLAVRLQTSLADAGQVPSRRTRVAVLGAEVLPATNARLKEETIGGSIFEWESGNPWRVVMLLQVLGAEGLVGTTAAEDYRRAIEIGRSMPDWPAPGSVVVVDDLAVIRFGEPTPRQIGYSQPARGD